MIRIHSLILTGLLAVSSHVLAQNAEMTEAEVRKVDVVAAKLTLKHGEIKNLGMPPMTMVFQVKDPAFLAQVKAGDRVNFTADKIKGAYTVLSIEVIQ
jgi:Cu/Ag efflux protein CusF